MFVPRFGKIPRMSLRPPQGLSERYWYGIAELPAPAPQLRVLPGLQAPRGGRLHHGVHDLYHIYLSIYLSIYL